MEMMASYKHGLEYVWGYWRRDQEERDFQDFARSQDPTAEDRILSHMAPGIFGHENIKRAVACLLFGGTRKVFLLLAPPRAHRFHPLPLSHQVGAA